MLRRAIVAHAERLARVVIEGFEVYREFAPPGWEPPPAEDEIERAEETTPKLAHLRNLFVDRSLWGSGLARGWMQAGDEFHSEGPDLVIVEYRLQI